MSRYAQLTCTTYAGNSARRPRTCSGRQPSRKFTARNAVGGCGRAVPPHSRWKSICVIRTPDLPSSAKGVKLARPQLLMLTPRRVAHSGVSNDERVARRPMSGRVRSVLRRHNLLVLALQVILIGCVPVMWFMHNPYKLTAAIIAPVASLLWIVAVLFERKSS